MEKQYLKRLIDKFQAGTISDNEREQLDLWYRSFEDTKGFTQALTKDEKAAMEVSLLNKVNAEIDVPQASEKRWIPLPRFDGSRLYLPSLRTAAVFSMVFFVAVFGYFFLHSPTITHATGYGQTAHFILPDGSIIILNGNSRINYKKRWSNNGAREVFLDGEAYFAVSHTVNQQKFIVHTSDGVHVEVLGTEFTASNRRYKTRVVLNTGKIELNIRDQQTYKKVTMLPGELVEFGDSPLNYDKRKVNPEVYSSWKDNKLILDHTSLKELLAMIADTYGLELRVVEEDLLGQRISGTIPLKNLDTLVQDIAAIYDVRFHKY